MVGDPRNLRGYRFSANSAASGGVGGSIVSAGQQTCGPEYARGMDPAGEGGVETFPHCYGLPSYCGWQQVAGSQNVVANTAGQITVVPTVSPYFEGKAIYMFGIDAAAPGTNLRFTVSDVSVGGAPQLAISGAATGMAGAAELLSDVFNRSDEPLLISWAIFSTVALARQLTIDVFNINAAVNIDIWVAIWGNARDSLPPLPGAGGPGYR